MAGQVWHMSLGAETAMHGSVFLGRAQLPWLRHKPW